MALYLSDIRDFHFAFMCCSHISSAHVRQSGMVGAQRVTLRAGDGQARLTKITYGIMLDSIERLSLLLL